MGLDTHSPHQGPRMNHTCRHVTEVLDGARSPAPESDPAPPPRGASPHEGGWGSGCSQSLIGGVLVPCGGCSVLPVPYWEGPSPVWMGVRVLSVPDWGAPSALLGGSQCSQSPIGGVPVPYWGRSQCSQFPIGGILVPYGESQCSRFLTGVLPVPYWGSPSPLWVGVRVLGGVCPSPPLTPLSLPLPSPPLPLPPSLAAGRAPQTLPAGRRERLPPARTARRGAAAAGAAGAPRTAPPAPTAATSPSSGAPTPRSSAVCE